MSKQRRDHRLNPGPLVKLVLQTFVCAISIPAVAVAQSDTMPPVIIDVQISSIMVTAIPQPTIVYFDVRFTDNLSGAWLSEVLLEGPSGGSQTLSGGGNADNGDLISGTALSGTIRAEIIFPAYVPDGDWTIAHIRIRDHAGNFTTLLPGDLAARGFPKKITVTMGQSDTMAPAIVDFQISSLIVTAIPQPTIVHFDVRFTDNLSGAWLSEVLLQGPSGGSQTLSGAGNADNGDLISGTTLSGTLRADIIFPAYVPDGDWTIARIRIRDHAGNFTTLLPGDLAARGFPIKITVTMGKKTRAQITSVY